jgi:spore germination protein GerM
MSRDPFDQMKSRNPVPSDQAPAAPMAMADRIVGRDVVRRGWPGWAVATATAVLVLAAGGGMYWWLSGGSTDVAGTTTTSPVTTTNPATTADGVIYLFSDRIPDTQSPDWVGGPYLIPVTRQVSGTDPVAGVMAALLAGPTADEAAQTPAFGSAIPTGTTLNGVTVSDGVASVDLSAGFMSGGGSASMTGRLAQVVFSLTRIDGIDGVRFLIDGTPTTVFGGEGVIVNDPATRSDFSDSLPAVMIESPAWDGTGGNPLVVSGTANVFEAVVSLTLTDGDGLILWEGTAMATCGTGCRGDWTATIPYTVDTAQWGSVIAWEASAMDGSQTNVREHRVWLTPSSGATAQGAVYFLADGDRDTAQSGPYLIPVARAIDPNDPYRSTMEALLAGPDTTEIGVSTAIPTGTSLDGVSVTAGVATVQLSGEFTSGGGSLSMMGRLAQVIYTMTRFPEVDGVRFVVDGTLTTVFGGEGVVVDDPAARPSDDALLPAVMIESPVAGGVGGNPLVVTGTANVFEATVSVALYAADGSTLSEGFTTATCGTGCRGDWTITIPYTVDQAQWGRLEAFESSARDGSPINVRTHAVWLTPADGAAPSCSAGNATTLELTDQAGLPDAVQATRTAVWQAATSCDWTALRALLGPGFSYTFGEDTDAIAYWQGLEASGDDPMYFLVELLARPFGVITNGDITYYVWPSAFNQSGWQDVPQADIDALRPLYDDADFAGFAEFGGYYGYRVGILADGTWTFFVAGD